MSEISIGTSSTGGNLADRLSPQAMGQLLEITRRMAGERRLDHLLEVILQESTRLMRAERASLFLYDAATDELYSKIAQKSEIGEIRFPASVGIAGHIARHRVCLNIPDAYKDSRFNPEPDRQTGFRTRSILGCPMLDISGNLVGVLEVLNKTGGPFTPHDECVLSVLGAQAGVALERARLLEEYLTKLRLEQELSVARQIQQALLPRDLPRLRHFDVAGWSMPAEETGGDIFDIFPLPQPARTALMLGDATGHGVGPALMICAARAAFRAMAAQTADLEATMAEVNRLLSEDSTDGRFVTLLAALIDDETGRVSYTSAGQGPTMLLKNDGRVHELATTGPPLGILPMFRWPSAQIDMDDGDVLVIVSDGIVECANAANDQLGVEPLMEAVRSNRRRSAEEIVRAVAALTDSFAAGEPFRDDRTAIIMKRTDRR
jgi:phosphoserine phosphatase RsbU/P